MTNVRIQRWGNSQGIRLPKSILAAVKLMENDQVEVEAVANTIIIRKAKRYDSLDQLFAGYSGGYVPGEFSTGENIGREDFDE